MFQSRVFGMGRKIQGSFKIRRNRMLKEEVAKLIRQHLAYPEETSLKIADEFISLFKQSFKDAVPKEREEKGYLARDVRWHEDNGFNKCRTQILTAIDKL